MYLVAVHAELPSERTNAASLTHLVWVRCTPPVTPSNSYEHRENDCFIARRQMRVRSPKFVILRASGISR